MCVFTVPEILHGQLTTVKTRYPRISLQRLIICFLANYTHINGNFSFSLG